MMRLLPLAALALLATAFPPDCHASAEDKQHALVPTLDPDDLSTQAKDMIKDALRKQFMYPDMVLWKYDAIKPYPTGGVVVCGRVNVPNSTRAYIGDKPFFAVIRDGGVFTASIPAPTVIDPRQEWLAAFHIACG